jgi:hypothetical protein
MSIRKVRPAKKSSKASPRKKGATESPIKKSLRPKATRKNSKALKKKEASPKLELAKREHPLLSVKYEEALQIRPLLQKMGEDAHAGLLSMVSAHGGDGLAFALQGASLAVNNGAFVAKFSAEAARLFKAGELRLLMDVSGKRLPTLVGASGKTVANARLLGPLAKGTTIAANIATAAITVAHIVSGIDLAKKMDRLNGKVDFLVAGRRIDQLSRLEGVYRHAKELLHGGLDDYSQKELHRLGRELFEIRSSWRGEISYHVSRLNKANESVNQFIAFFESFSRKGKDQKIADTVCACDTEIHLINVSIATHMALAQASGRLDAFLQVSLPDELEQITMIRELLWSRRDFIHDKHPELRANIEKSCYHLDDIVSIYRPMVMNNQSILQNG